MKNEYRFTFCRWTKRGPEENSDSATFPNFDEAMQWAENVCRSNDCRIKEIEWFDPDLDRWTKSVVSYA